MKMHKKEIEKDDGRNLIFYTFEGAEKDSKEDRSPDSTDQQSKKEEG